MFKGIKNCKENCLIADGDTHTHTREKTSDNKFIEHGKKKTMCKWLHLEKLPSKEVLTEQKSGHSKIWNN